MANFGKNTCPDDAMKNNPHTLRAWCMYDWANSAHALVIVSAIFPDYFVAVATYQNTPCVSIFGFLVKNSVVFSYTIAISYTFIVLLNPYLSARADSSGQKKIFMQAFVTLGASACASLFFFTQDTQLLGIIAFGLSLVGFSGSLVFYNAYLPEIATPDQYDALSARGFAWGFLGSVILLCFCLSMILMPKVYGGISESWACRISFLLTGAWWWGFAQYTLAMMPAGVGTGQASAERRTKVWRELGGNYALKTFVFAFFWYNMGLQTVMYVAAIFGKSELHIPTAMLIATILVIQLLAIVGALSMARLSKAKGNIFALRVAVVVWIGVCLAAYFINQVGFYILGVVIGWLMGGTQSLSRATFAKLMPADTPDRASYFAIYEMADKLAIVFGTASYALIEQVMGSARYSVVALAVYFAVGAFMLSRLRSK